MSPVAGTSVSPADWVRSWSAVAAILLVGTAVAAAFEAFVLEMFVSRPPDGGSLTTLLPAMTYASATVMKICAGAGVVAGVVGLAAWARRRPSVGNPGRPGLVLLSAAVPPLTLVVATVVVLLAQVVSGTSTELMLADFRRFGRFAVFAMMGLLATGVATAAVGWRRGERPGTLALFVAGVNGGLLWLFWHLHFYAPQFDQDTWAGQG